MFAFFASLAVLILSILAIGLSFAGVLPVAFAFYGFFAMFSAAAVEPIFEALGLGDL